MTAIEYFIQESLLYNNTTHVSAFFKHVVFLFSEYNNELGILANLNLLATPFGEIPQGDLVGWNTEEHFDKLRELYLRALQEKGSVNFDNFILSQMIMICERKLRD